MNIRTWHRGAELGHLLARNRENHKIDLMEARTGEQFARPAVPEPYELDRNGVIVDADSCAGALRVAARAESLSDAAGIVAKCVEGLGADAGPLHLIQRKHKVDPTPSAGHFPRENVDRRISRLRNPLSSQAFHDADASIPGRKKLHRAANAIAKALRQEGQIEGGDAGADLKRRGDEILYCEWGWQVAVNRQRFEFDASKAVGHRRRVVAAGSEARPVAGYHCRQRLCPKCQAVRALKWAQRVAPMLEEVRAANRQPKFLTLTQPSIVDEPLAKARERMEGAYRKLTRSIEWRGRAAAWLTSREVTWSKGAWHYHVHMVVDMDYWPHRDLCWLWSAFVQGPQTICTLCNGAGESCSKCYGIGRAVILDIRAARLGTEREIVKYALKTLTVPARRLMELVEATHGKRMVSTGGAWRGRVKQEDMEPNDDLPPGWDFVDLATLHDAVKRGERWAQLAMGRCMAWLEERNAAALARFTGALLHPDDGRRLAGLRSSIPDAGSINWLTERDLRVAEVRAS